MARHQIIYTSCMRGIDGVNDGQQIFSYDESFKESKSDEVKSLFTYQVPSLPAGTIMSEEIAKTMPASFGYRCLKSGSVALSLNTYLGRDYMGSAGRFGNHLSHSILCDFSDFDVYPCELYASVALRNSMDYEEVNNPNPPAYLPTPELTKGYVIDTDSIIEFLGIGENLEHFKKMLTALLRFGTEKKRIVINDEPENIVKWIAALHYALPLDIAKRVNFASYEFDPELSSSQICGVISQGTKYNCANYASSKRHYVFDFINNQFNQVDFDSQFIDFIDTAFSFSYDSLTEFHDFVIERTTYRGCDQNYYAAYYLYNLLSEGLNDISCKEFKALSEFADEFVTNGIKQEIIYKLIDEQDIVRVLDNEYALTVLGFMLKSLDCLDNSQQMVVKQMIVDRLISALASSNMNESVFTPLYDSIDSLARTINLSIPSELMVDQNRNALLGVLSQNTEQWKINFVVRIISEYVHDMQLSIDELVINKPIGAIFYGIVKLGFASGRQNGYEVMEKILCGFVHNIKYYVNMAINIEGFFKDMGLPETDIRYLWDYFEGSVMKFEEAEIGSVNRELEYNELYGEMANLFIRRIRGINELAEIKECFEEYWARWVVRNNKFASENAEKLLKEYYQIYEKKMTNISSKEQFLYARDILHMAMEQRITGSFVDILSLAVCEYIPLEKLNSDNQKIINELYKYQKDVLNKQIDGRLLLFIIAQKLGEVVNKRDIAPKTQEINDIASEKGAEFIDMTEGKIKDYYEWAFDSIANFRLSSEDYTSVYNLFKFTKSTQSLFMEYWCKASYKKCKGDEEHTDFSEFLLFMFEYGNDDDQETVGKYLCKLSKQKLEDLDNEMKNVFKRDRKATHAWENIEKVASSTNPLINNLSGIFRRK